MRRTYKHLGRFGRLGNQLWQIASTYGIAKREGSDVKFPPWSYAQHFKVPMDLFTNYYEQPGDVDMGETYLQDLSNIAGVEDTIRKWFKARRFADFNDWFPDISVYPPACALHVRRGDAIGKEQWHPLCTMKYYETAIEIVRNRGIDRFLVFSDDIEWCRSVFPSDFRFVSPHIPLLNTSNPTDHCELLLMTKCFEHIISNSTFSWWGAWLSGNERVITPSVWFGPSYPQLDHRVTIPDSWITVEC